MAGEDVVVKQAMKIWLKTPKDGYLGTLRFQDWVGWNMSTEEEENEYPTGIADFLRIY